MKWWKRSQETTAPSAPNPQRLQMMLLASVAIVLLAYIVRVRPMQAETDELLISFESESATASEPQVEVARAAYTSDPQKALADFYAQMEQMLRAEGISVESRQARIETDPRYPAATLIYECRCRMKWPALLSFFSAVRNGRPRVRMTRISVRRLDEPQTVEIFFEARSLALGAGGVA